MQTAAKMLGKSKFGQGRLAEKRGRDLRGVRAGGGTVERSAASRCRLVNDSLCGEANLLRGRSEPMQTLWSPETGVALVCRKATMSTQNKPTNGRPPVKLASL